MNTKQFFNFISSSLGKDASKCSHCKNKNISCICGGCMKVAFCGAACHKKAWNLNHKLDCMLIEQGLKREHDENNTELKDNRANKRPKEYIYFTDEFKDIFQVMQSWLSANDIRNMSVASKQLNIAMRKTFFQSQTYAISIDVLNNVFFKSIASEIQNVFIVDLDRFDLIKLKEMAPNILQMTFDQFFNQDVIGALPQHLRHLTFGEEFDQDVNGALPQNLTHLTFGWDFNQVVKPGTLPQSLTHLTFSWGFNQVVEPGTLPQRLTHLTFGWHFNQVMEPGTLPQSLTHLTFGPGFNQVVELDTLPQSLTHLTFGEAFNQDVRDVLPQNLKHLTFGWKFNQNVRGALPQSLTHLTFDWDFNQNVRGALPQSLTHLTFGNEFNQDLSKVLPQRLEYLNMEGIYNHRITNLLPMSVRIIKIVFDAETLSTWREEADRVGAELIID